MTLPSDFQFSQSNLQDYADCPRRFYLRHVRRLAWPAIQAEPAMEHERHLRQGLEFHRLVHQELLGVPAELVVNAVTDENLRRWWGNYMEKGPADLPESLYPELILSATLSDYRLVAKYDLIAVDVGSRAVIIEWKTYRQRPPRSRLAARLQTRVYPFLLIRAGTHLNDGQPIDPERVEMVYWFANFPHEPVVFGYDTGQFQADESYLAGLIAKIKDLHEEDFCLTEVRERCEYCPYRSLCRRGTHAGAFEESDGDWEPDEDFGIPLDLEQIAEVEF